MQKSRTAGRQALDVKQQFVPQKASRSCRPTSSGFGNDTQVGSPDILGGIRHHQ